MHHSGDAHSNIEFSVLRRHQMLPFKHLYRDNFEVTARETKMSTCQIKTCKNNHRKAEFSNIHFYRFPKEALILKWKVACGKENVNVKNGMYKVTFLLTYTRYI
ncbi:hypothetical protein ALC57_12019 [Trachymyrmex cornetzi]|uniref:THAP-type domain-containing protein n=1 Tax=Trachymyrmex cornetzi TaxID=471704 RepID=A0A151J1K8_9HYME|nr:hypothetical protein ALC57_12019 [Trachymyrmex cornetzi]